MRTRYVFREGQGVVQKARPVANPARSDLPAPMVISDGMGDVWNPADGKTYDSKSSYYRAVRDAGCVIVGNEKMDDAPRDQIGVGNLEQDISNAIEELSHG